jgi:hypothetical protein
MSNDTIECPYCHDQLWIQMYESDCNRCNVKFVSRQVHRQSNDPWRIFYQSFRINGDKTYHSISMHLENRTTTVWLHHGSNDPFRQIPIQIDGIFPINKPEDALPLARRLHNLIAFI